ncbi:MAG: ABC transporter permease subunit [Spirochaetota bacterium]
MGRRPGRLVIGLLSTVALLLVWHIVSLRMAKDLILPSPLLVGREFAALAATPLFLASLWATFIRGLVAFFLSTVAGIIVGFAAGRYAAFEAAISPLLTTIRATPVLALILLTLLWFPSDFVPVFAAFLMAFPVMASSAVEGIRASPPELLEMSRLYRVPRMKILLGLRIPAAMPHILAGARSAIGLCWKVVVAGEVLAQPFRAIGTGMQSSRVLLETPRVFAWAFSAILLCGASEWLFARLTRERRSGAL